MAGGANFPDEDLPRDYFAGQKHIKDTPDDFPDLHELLNAMRVAGSARLGIGTVDAGLTTEAVTFSTAFPTGTTVGVVATSQASDVNVWVTSISETGCTLNISGVLGSDEDIAYIAFAVA